MSEIYLHKMPEWGAQQPVIELELDKPLPRNEDEALSVNHQCDQIYKESNGQDQ